MGIKEALPLKKSLKKGSETGYQAHVSLHDVYVLYVNGYRLLRPLPFRCSFFQCLCWG
ncbi:hypothetical protein LX66_0912 [Chitinophaga japonensis]|uniref:Uncharacterized protein n=1 Tax=Chitinophaga japonensis TaxID=104662 RepID=A0A562TDA7_CHIJA|nr:hypothetical protein LX66_0912 [Chitinophaga japonensis]